MKTVVKRFENRPKTCCGRFNNYYYPFCQSYIIIYKYTYTLYSENSYRRNNIIYL